MMEYDKRYQELIKSDEFKPQILIVYRGKLGCGWEKSKEKKSKKEKGGRYGISRKAAGA